MGKIRKMSSTDHKSTFLLQIFTGFHPCKGTMRPVWTSLAMQGLVFMKETRFLHLAPKFGLVAVTHWHSGSRAFYNRNRSSDINIQFPCLIFVFLLPYDLPETAFFLVTRCTEIDQTVLKKSSLPYPTVYSNVSISDVKETVSGLPKINTRMLQAKDNLWSLVSTSPLCWTSLWLY